MGNLKRVTHNYLLYLNSDKYTEEDAQKYLSSEGFTQERYDTAIENQTKKEDAGKSFIQKVNETLEPVTNFTNNAVDELTFGGSVYLRAMLQATADEKETGDYNFDSSLGKVREKIRDYKKESPVASTVADITGAVGGAFLPVAGVSKVLGLGKFSKLKGARKVAKDVVGGGITAGATSGLQTASIQTARGDKDAGEQTVMATGMGATMGAGLPLMSPLLVGAKKIVQALKDNPKISNEIGEGWDQFKSFFTKSDGTIDPNIQKQIKEHEDLGLADDMTAFDLMDESAVKVVSSNLRSTDPTSPAKREAYEFLRTRLANTKDQVSDFIGKGMKFPKRVSMDAEQKMFRDQAREQAKPYYQKAYFNDDGTYKTIQNTELDEIFSRPDFMESYKKAQKQAKNSVDGRVLPKFPMEQRYQMVDSPNSDYFVDGLPKEFARNDAGNLIPISNDPVKWPVWALDSVKKHLDRKYKYAGHPNADPSLTGSKADISILKKKMIGIVEEGTENNYKVARSKYQGQARLEEALDDGGTLFKPSLNGPNAKNMFKQLKTEDEKTQFRVGAYNSLVDMIENTGDEANPRAVADLFKSKKNIAKLELIVPDAEERGKLIRRLELLGERIYKDKILVKGSQTASNLATDGNQASNAVQAVSDVANRRVGNTLRNVENFVRPETIKANAEKGTNFAFQKGGNVQKAVKQGQQGLLSQAMKRKANDPLNLLGFGAGVSSGSAQQFGD